MPEKKSGTDIIDVTMENTLYNKYVGQLSKDELKKELKK